MENNSVPMMSAFRDAFEKKDAKKRLDLRTEGGERLLSSRGANRRHGSSEGDLKRSLSIDLVSLSNTINLESAIDLGECEYVRRSILNFGLMDVSHLTSEERAVEEIADILKNSLIAHEPRISEEDLTIEKVEEFDDVNQRISFNVAAEMISKPYNIPIEFIAEVEAASGKVLLKKLPGTT